MTKTKSNGNSHIQRITFFLTPILESIKKNNKVTHECLQKDNDSSVYCDCKSFKYHFSNLNKKRGSYYLGSKNKNKNDYKTKGLRPSPNPRKLGGLCKHLKFDIDYIDKNIKKITEDIQKYLSKEKVLDKIINKTVNKEVDKVINQMNKQVDKSKNDLDKTKDSNDVKKVMREIEKDTDLDKE